MPVTRSVKVIDHGWTKIREAVINMGAASAIVRVGVQGEKGAANHQHSKLTVAQIADVHEFGRVIVQPKMRRVIVIPERSFLRKTVDIHREAIARREMLALQGVLYKEWPLSKALGLLGAYVVGLCQQRIANRIPPKNSDWTIAKKKSNVPLIDTGQLRNSITWKVEGTP
jgi:hypothetical protein